MSKVNNASWCVDVSTAHTVHISREISGFGVVLSATSDFYGKIMGERIAYGAVVAADDKWEVVPYKIGTDEGECYALCDRYASAESILENIAVRGEMQRWAGRENDCGL